MVSLILIAFFFLSLSTWRQFFYTDSNPVQLSFHTENISIVATCMLQNISISYLITSVNSVKDTHILSITSITLNVPFDAVLYVQHHFTFRNWDCWYHCPVVLDYGVEFDSFLPPHWLNMLAATIVTLHPVFIGVSVISQDTSQTGQFLLLVKTSRSSLLVIETLCLTFFPVAGQYILLTEWLRSLLYPEIEMMLNVISVEKSDCI